MGGEPQQGWRHRVLVIAWFRMPIIGRIWVALRNCPRLTPTRYPGVNKELAIFVGIVPDAIKCDGYSLGRNVVERSLPWI
jgi:hypothetical protein